MRPSAPTTYQRIIQRFKLEDQFSIMMDMDKAAFLQLLKENIDEDTGPQFFESINPKLKPYKGFISLNGFKIKRRRRAFESNNDMARITGTLKSDFRHTELITHIGYPEMTLKLIFGLILVVYLVVLTVVFSVDIGESPSWVPWLIVGHFFLIFGILLFVLRYQIRTSTKKVRRFLTDLVEQESTNNDQSSSELDPSERLNLKRKENVLRRRE